MNIIGNFFWAVLALGLVCPAAGRSALKTDLPRRPDAAEADLPETAKGAFVQRKTLADVGVTLTSKGAFEFARERFFKWDTREPMPSVFYATPTNYAITVNGRTNVHPINVDVHSIAGLFAIKEMREFVQSVKTTPATGFPESVSVTFKNGDRLDIELKRVP